MVFHILMWSGTQEETAATELESPATLAIHAIENDENDENDEDEPPLENGENRYDLENLSPDEQAFAEAVRSIAAEGSAPEALRSTAAEGSAPEAADAVPLSDGRKAWQTRMADAITEGNRFPGPDCPSDGLLQLKKESMDPSHVETLPWTPPPASAFTPSAVSEMDARIAYLQSLGLH